MYTPIENASSAATILLVDDQPGNINLLRRYLKRSDFNLAVATNGATALRISHKLRPDLILLDVMMPDIDGYETCRRLKADPTSRDVPVVFVTARTQPEDIERGFAVGAADYICKPVQQQELLVRVSNQLMLKRTRELQLARLQENEKLAQLGHLVGALAHELATPLGNAQLVLSSLTDRMRAVSKAMSQRTVDTAELTQLIDTALRSLEMACNGLSFAATTVQSFKAVAVDQCADVRYSIRFGSYLDKVLISLRPRLKHSSIKVQVNGPSDLEFVTYPGAFAQIFTNLIENSLVHGYDENVAGTITIDYATSDGQLKIDYRDDGAGIATQHLPHIFENYFTTKPGCGGSGLGMNIVKTLVCDKLGGEIQCESTPGKGVHFAIQVPLSPAEAVTGIT
ncbi:sensor histidine kinase [Tahibacter amnicola]|uniref:histidine kinase n=1 Tax=Tahibacter amnicola TaxID=2976241 RepID=A0ABY6BQS8_9GAMM|nr:hybrid sensor histidine kinase/response regulator [Tahibacter amnicola]UXI70122.1 hybrid sensor histidine kinase/response regulator [Tahibacter amnicola]